MISVARLRAVVNRRRNGMTEDYYVRACVPWGVANSIINEVAGINRVTYEHHIEKPPGDD